TQPIVVKTSQFFFAPLVDANAALLRSNFMKQLSAPSSFQGAGDQNQHSAMRSNTTLRCWIRLRRFPERYIDPMLADSLTTKRCVRRVAHPWIRFDVTRFLLGRIVKIISKQWPMPVELLAEAPHVFDHNGMIRGLPRDGGPAHAAHRQHIDVVRDKLS